MLKSGRHFIWITRIEGAHKNLGIPRDAGVRLCDRTLDGEDPPAVRERNEMTEIAKGVIHWLPTLSETEVAQTEWEKGREEQLIVWVKEKLQLLRRKCRLPARGREPSPPQRPVSHRPPT